MGSDHGHHDHDHDHDELTHGVSANADKRLLAIALALLLGYMASEIVVGLMAGSLVLLSDAGHMLTDAGAIGLALITMRLAERPPGGAMTFGLKRAEILSAQANGITLMLLGIWFFIEAVRRLIAPPPVEGIAVFWVAIAGIGVNLCATWVLSRANRESLNVEGSFQHILTDLYAFIATAVAGLLIVFTGINRFDPIATLLVAGLMARAGYGLLKESGRIFMEAAPRGLDPDEIGRALAAETDVMEVHDLHVWEVTSGFPSLSAHILVRGDHPCHGDCHTIRLRLETMLQQRFAIRHTTLQVDHLYARETRIPPDALREHLNHPA